MQWELATISVGLCTLFSKGQRHFTTSQGFHQRERLSKRDGTPPYDNVPGHSLPFLRHVYSSSNAELNVYNTSSHVLVFYPPSNHNPGDIPSCDEPWHHVDHPSSVRGAQREGSCGWSMEPVPTWSVRLSSAGICPNGRGDGKMSLCIGGLQL